MKLYNEDCKKVLSDYLANNIQVNHVIVDLPYFKVVKNNFDNQWKTEQDYLDWIREIFLIIYNILDNNGNLLLFCSRQMQHKIYNILENIGFAERRTIIWARKRGFNNTRGRALASGYEPIMYFTKQSNNKPIFNNIKIKIDSTRPEYNTGYLKDGITLSDVWTDISALPHNSKEKVDHPTQKPIKLMERLVSLFTNPGQTILDFCMGSGSTGVACKNLNRDFIGVENNKSYFDIAYKRLI
jgi:site-specific DNA-methyltransferase (adenine-specific)